MFTTNCKKIFAYTLAEMLVVLVILSVVLLAAPPLTKKLFKLKATEKRHGRFECYRDANNVIMQYKVDGSNVTEPIAATNQNVGCVFNPPSNALYIMIHAVGGGGAGYSDIGTITDSNNKRENISATTYLSYSSVALWPDWFKYLMDHSKNSIKEGSIASDSYETKKDFVEQTVLYGLSGMPGERVSMLFPALSSNIEISIIPGLGAETPATSKGEDTEVRFKYSSDGTRTLVINAKGGNSGTGTGTYSSALSGGKATDFGVGNFQAVGLKTSTFENVIESSNLNQISKINNDYKPIPETNDTRIWKQKAGWGGNGAYFYLGGNALGGSYTYQINNYTQQVTSSDNFIKNDYWKTVTSLLPTYFYKRNGQTGNCELTDGDINLSFSCNKLSNSDKYICPIKDNETEINLYGISKCSLGSCLSTTESDSAVTPMNPEGTTLTACMFRDISGEVTCTKSNVENSKYVCSATENASAFSCPEGITGTTTNNNYGICNAGRGGNGAVIILW